MPEMAVPVKAKFGTKRQEHMQIWQRSGGDLTAGQASRTMAGRWKLLLQDKLPRLFSVWVI